jgi:hypothetical protein
MADLPMGLVTTVPEAHELWSVVSVFFTLPESSTGCIPIEHTTENLSINNS